MKRILIFVHYSKDPFLNRNVLAYLKALQSFFSRKILVSNSALNEHSHDLLRDLDFELIVRENQGYDFYSWKIGLSHIADSLPENEELVMANDSCLLVKNSDFTPIFGWSGSKQVWGLTKSYEFQEHLQSYFLGFKREAFQSHGFQAFWKKLEVLDSKNEIIMNYEVGLSHRLISEGFKLESYFRIEDVPFLKKIRILFKSFKQQPGALFKLKPKAYYGVNPSHELWEEMIQAGIPLVKRELSTKNPMQLNIDHLENYLHSEDRQT